MSHPERPSVLTLFLVNSVGGGLFGYNIGVIAGANNSLVPHFDLHPLPKGLIGGLFLLGAMLGSISGSSLCNQYGRRKALGVSGGIGMVGTILGAISPWLGLVYFSRCLMGLCVGLASTVCPLYVSELAQEKRALLMSNFQGSLTFFILLAFALSYAINDFTDWGVDVRWRALYLIGGLLPLSAIFLSAVMPESTVWRDQRKRSLIEHVNDSDRIGLMASTEALMVAPGGGWTGLFSPLHRHALTSGAVLGVMVALTGINAVMFYAPTIFSNAGFEKTKNLMTVFLGAWNFLCTLVAMAVVGRLGSKPLLLLGLAVQAIGLGVLGIAVHFRAQFGESMASSIAMLGLFASVSAYAVGPGMVFWILVVDTFSESVRAQGSSLINMQQWLENLILTAVFPLLVGTTEHPNIPIEYLFWGFAVVAMVCFVLLYGLIRPKKEFVDLDSVE